VPGEAGVVAVAVLVAVGGAADEAGTAARARDESGEQVVGAVGSTSGVVLPAGDQNLLGGVERLQVNERLVRCRVEALAEEDLTDVGPVAEHSQDCGGIPWTSCASAVTALGKPVTDGSRAQVLLGVKVEDDGDEWRFVGVDLQVAGCGVDAVAEGSGAAAPFAAGGFSFHPGDDPIDDGGPFELGEHAEHLHHHPTRSGRGVERFRRAAERHPSGVELFEQRGEAANRAGEPVDSVDQQEVVTVRFGFGERAL
jgi:hypothetical protein